MFLNKLEFSQNFRSILQQAGQIPPLPETARSLLRLRNNPDANLDQLTELIEQDPGLSIFIMKYARMSVFGYGNRIHSVHHAISLVIGFDTALNLSMSIVSSGCLKMPNHGVLSRSRIWNQTLECAMLCRELCHISSNNQMINRDLMYLGGLFHNFGYFLFAHLYPREFTYLNDLISRYPKQDIRSIQMQVFGITHDTIGMYLIKSWNLPEEIATTVAEQHFPDYSGKHAGYVKLIAVANRLLRNHSNTDGCPYLETSVLLESLGINETEAIITTEKVRNCRSEITLLAEELAA